jgi:hypothetical protein
LDKAKSDIVLSAQHWGRSIVACPLEKYAPLESYVFPYRHDDDDGGDDDVRFLHSLSGLYL